MIMKYHRNTPRRVYIEGGVYFITANTYKKYPYFENQIFCNLLIEELLLCKKIKEFELYGYKINPEHVHLLMQPGGKYTFSSIMHFLKRNFSQNINKVIGINPTYNRRGCATTPIIEF